MSADTLSTGEQTYPTEVITDTDMVVALAAAEAVVSREFEAFRSTDNVQVEQRGAIHEVPVRTLMERFIRYFAKLFLRRGRDVMVTIREVRDKIQLFFQTHSLDMLDDIEPDTQSAA